VEEDDYVKTDPVNLLSRIREVLAQLLATGFLAKGADHRYRPLR